MTSSSDRMEQSNKHFLYYVCKLQNDVRKLQLKFLALK